MVGADSVVYCAPASCQLGGREGDIVAVCGDLIRPCSNNRWDTQNCKLCFDNPDRPDEFLTDRPAYQYMHFGYGMHTCLGNYISEVQVPEMVKEIITLPNVCRASKMETGVGDFPSKLEVSFSPDQ